ncbi:hypothetical protein AAKU55_002868 [Oxalobacteraceae bacterium GrIS 1.11]
MRTTAFTLLGAAIGVACIAAGMLARPSADQAEAVLATTAPPRPASAPVGCATGANPFDTGAPCPASQHGAAPAGVAGRGAAAIGKTLRELERCKSPCRLPASDKAAMLGRLEDLSQGGDAQAQFELGLQASAGRSLNDAEVADDYQLQRAVALMAQAAAAGNADAQRFRDASGEHAKLLHTGR